MAEINYFEIDDKKYMITSQVENEKYIYYFLSNMDNTSDIMIRKSSKDHLTTILPLDNEDEVIEAMNIFEKTMIEDLIS